MGQGVWIDGGFMLESGEMFVSGIFLCSPFILRPIWLDESAFLRIPCGDLVGTSHFLFAFSRNFFCQPSHLDIVSLFITPCLLFQLLKQYPRFLNLGQHLLCDPFKSGGGFLDQIGLRKTFL